MDMYDALNIRTVSSENDNAGIVQNMLGNTKVDYELGQSVATQSYTFTMYDTGEVENGEPVYRSDELFLNTDTSTGSGTQTYTFELDGLGDLGLFRPNSIQKVQFFVQNNGGNIGVVRAKNADTDANLFWFSGSAGSNFFGWSNFKSNPVINVTSNLDFFHITRVFDGDNKVIGTIKHQENNNLFYFIWNKQGNHRIAVYNDITQSVTTVLETPLLNFVQNAFVNGFAITKVEDNETLLYFTDDINPPRNINVEKAIGFTSGSGEGYTSIDEQVLDLIKYPPVFPPTTSVVIDDTKGINNLGYGMFQFRYRYFYDDAETSAYSPVSEITISDFLLRTNVFEKNSRDDYNAVDVTFNNGSQDCRKIEVIFRNGNEGEWKVFDIFDNDLSNVGSPRTERFYNDGNFGISDPTETNKLYDAVPITAATQDFLGKRNIMANAVDGYNNLEDGVLEDGLSITPRFLDSDEVASVDIPTSKNSIYVPDDAAFFYEYDYDFSGVSVEVPNYVYMMFASKFFDYTIQKGDTINDVVDYFKQKFDDLRKNGGLNPDIVSVVSIGTTIRLSTSVGALDRNFSQNAYWVEALSVRQSFKAGATHDFGIVFGDRGNRTQTVQKKDESGVYVDFFGERSGNAGDNGLQGATVMDWSLDITPPSWATHYQFVYTGNTSVDRFLQFNCARAYRTGLSNQPNDIDTDYVYVGMRHFSGKQNSYDTKSILEYQYVQGDRLRMISYWDTDLNRRVYPSETIDFQIAGYEFFENDSFNPILNNSSADAIDSTTGWYLILNENDVEGWNRDSIGDNSAGLWCPDGLNSAYFEIYNPQRQDDNNVFYEFSESFPVINAGEANRSLGGQLRNQGQDVTLTPSNFSILSRDYLDFTERPALIIGDIVTMTGTLVDSISYTVANVVEQDSGDWRVYFTTKIVTSSLPTSVILQTKTAAGVFDEGDVWWKPRKMFDGTFVINKEKEVILYAEDFNASDFFASSNWSKGRVNAFSEYSAQVRRKASVWYSEPYFPDVAFNGLSSFNLSLTPYVDYESSFGAIKLIRRRGDTLIVYQEDKVGNVAVDKRVIESASGNQLLTLTDDVLSEINYYAGDFGIGNQPESWGEINGIHYFVSLKKGAALRLGGDGITQISKYKVFDYFRDRSKEYTTLYDKVKINGGVNIEYSEYVCSFPAITKGSISVGTVGTGYDIPNSSEDSENIYVTLNLSPIYMGMQPSLKWNTENRLWDNICENWEEWGNLLVDMEKVVSDGFLAYDFNEKDSKCLVKLRAGNTDYYAQATIDYSSGVLTIPKVQDCAGFTLVYSSSGETASSTIGFNEDNNIWTSFYSFNPEHYGWINFKMISFLNGELWVHDSNETRCSFYGVNYPHGFGTYMNQEPSAVKMFQAISLEGNKNSWSVNMSTNLTNSSGVQQETLIDTTFFEEREGFFYSDIPFASSGTTTSNIIPLGSVEAVNTNEYTMIGFEAGSGVSVGDEVFENSSFRGTITAISGNVLTIDVTSGTISVGDFIYVSKPTQFYGDVMRGRVMDMSLESTETGVNELFAVNVIAKNSSYHNV
jgi:hypothetical protein